MAWSLSQPVLRQVGSDDTCVQGVPDRIAG